MEKILLEDISRQAIQIKERYELYHNNIERWHQKISNTYTHPPKKSISTPVEWDDDKKFNPYYVLKRNKQIARSVSKKIRNGTYKPNKPFSKQIPKKGGGVRNLSIYQIQDSAVSYRMYKNLIQKNRHRFSSFSYAYRNDRNLHFAIDDIFNEFKTTHRIFVAEFDFKKFFESIQHEYLYEQLNSNGFNVSEIELNTIKSFIGNEFGMGIPLGTSISLFLANVVCWKLDRDLEDLGVRFARYADDTVIWTKDYHKISKAFDVIQKFSDDSGIKINHSKSDGISLLKRSDMTTEFKSHKEYVEFLGYKISTELISIKDSSVERIKSHISSLLYKNLLQPLNSIPIHYSNIPTGGRDKNFLGAIMEIRRYLYGNLSEELLKKYMNGTYKVLNFKGVMSFYPLINDVGLLKYLDSWLISTILNVVELRRKKLIKNNRNFIDFQPPFGLNKEELLAHCKQTVIGTKEGVMEIPSFLRIYNALKLGVLNNGIEVVMNSRSLYY
ncbi:reverse transcriptase domain-containing protein [Cellulophaga sp. Z1A5H]|uniref:reverse transcriptase domain-containing protein n=1 Tax=Cellulophaga sp. Z1A5H TaxID=2687291 RepID=UPI0013FD5A4E|nr:reverse transcriptase domain-containing protein [Cellulophaga sp. Z1A5H]